MTELKTSLDEQSEHLEQRLNKEPDSLELLLAWGEVNFKKGRFLKALDAFEKILAQDQMQSQIYLNLARIYYLKGMWTDSLEKLKKVAEFLPLNIEGFWLYDKIAQKSDKEDFFFESIPHYDNFKTTQDELASFQVKCQLESGDMDQLIGQYQVVLEKTDFDPLVEYDLRMLNLRRVYLENLFNEATTILKDQTKVSKSRKITITGKKISANLYEEVKADLRKVLEAFIQMRSITAVAVFDSKGEILESLSRKPMYSHKVYQETLTDIEFVDNWAIENKAGDLSFQIVEFSDGLWLSQKLSNKFSLNIIGEGLVNFGAIKYSLEKYKPQLIEILKKI